MKSTLKKKDAASPSIAAKSPSIYIHGAKENNLKNVSVDIPLYKLTVITGVSGSGKSSLAMDVLYAEAQRKFAESMTSYARQFLANAQKPSVDYIRGLSPAIAISQYKFSANARSTVGTVTEIHDYLRLLFARIGRIVSPKTGKEIKIYQAADIADELLKEESGKKCYITFGVEPEKGKEQESRRIGILQRKGFTRFLDADSMRIVDTQEGDDLANNMSEVLVDRVALDAGEENRNRIVDSIKIALFEGKGRAHVFFEKGGKRFYSTLLEESGVKFIAPSNNLFSYNNSLGICKTCQGYGSVLGIDPHLVIPDEEKSVYDGAIAPWKGEKMGAYLDDFMKRAAAYRFPIHKPINKLTPSQLDLLWKGNDDVRGIDDFFDELKRNAYKIQYRVLLSRYQNKTLCPECKGYRLCREALYIKIRNLHIGEISAMSVGALKEWLAAQTWDAREWAIAQRLIKEIDRRLDILMRVGLSYLTLNRTVSTLSGGESQRAQLTKFIGSNLTQSLYILDEPSIGLDDRDTDNLISVLRQLRDLGNTVVVVEHDENIIRSADYIIDMGPLAGREGGEVVASGTLKDILAADSLTAAYLKKKKEIKRTKKEKFDAWLSLREASLFNVKKQSVDIPLNALTVAHGASGAGKSTLINRILYPALCAQLRIPCEISLGGTYASLNVSDSSYIQDIQWISQHSIGRMSRSNCISYTKSYDDIRTLFAKQSAAKERFLTAGSFSFNSPGGRCEECKGEGVKVIEMQFLPSVRLECDSCKGRRFTDEALQVTLNGKNINDVLHLTVDEAVSFFQPYEKIARKMAILQKVGLGYVQLGQSTDTLSGGELQRLKLASFLSKASAAPTLFFFDEPTVGLHFDDVRKLVLIFDELIARGHTIVLIEHNRDLIRNADWLIEMGPESGDKGGKVVFCGAG